MDLLLALIIDHHRTRMVGVVGLEQQHTWSLSFTLCFPKSCSCNITVVVVDRKQQQQLVDVNFCQPAAAASRQTVEGSAGGFQLALYFLNRA